MKDQTNEIQIRWKEPQTSNDRVHKNRPKNADFDAGIEDLNEETNWVRIADLVGKQDLQKHKEEEREV